MKNKIYLILILLNAIVFPALAQKKIDFQEALTLLADHPAILATESRYQALKHLNRTSLELPRTSVMVQYGQYNSFNRDNNFTITQSFPFPSVVLARKRTLLAKAEAGELMREQIRIELVRELKALFNEITYREAKLGLLTSTDSLMQQLVFTTSKRYQAGEIPLIDKTLLETQAAEVRNSKRIISSERDVLLESLRVFLDNDSITAIREDFTKLNQTELVTGRINPGLKVLQKQVEVSRAEQKLSRQQMWPDLNLGYFNQTLIGFQNPDGNERFADGKVRFTGVMAGLSIPLAFRATAAKVKAANEEAVAMEQELANYDQRLSRNLLAAQAKVDQTLLSLEYYDTYALQQAKALEFQSLKSLRAGETGVTEFSVIRREILMIREGYLSSLYNYNAAIIELEHLQGNF